MTTNTHQKIDAKEFRQYVIEKIECRIRWIESQRCCKENICNIEEQVAKIDAEISLLEVYDLISDDEIETIYQRF